MIGPVHETHVDMLTWAFCKWALSTLLQTAAWQQRWTHDGGSPRSHFQHGSGTHPHTRCWTWRNHLDLGEQVNRLVNKEGKMHRTYRVSRAAGSTSARDTCSSSSIFWTSPVTGRKMNTSKDPCTQQALEDQLLHLKWWRNPPRGSQLRSCRSRNVKLRVFCQSKASQPRGRSAVDLDPKNTPNIHLSCFLMINTHLFMWNPNPTPVVLQNSL